MTRVCRVVLGIVLVLGAVRMAAYLVYAVCFLAAEFESFNLEAKMVLLADRVRAGESLYPARKNYPHVANIFGPLYFVVVGLAGRAASSDLHGLFLIGRAVTFGSALATSLVLAAYLSRCHGRGAALVGAVLSLGAAPMYGFSVMARPDFLAEFFGILGFFLTGLRSRSCVVVGGLILAAAILTKQTAVVFLLAASSALVLEGKHRRALILFGATIAVVLTVVGLGTIWVEPRMARDLLGESHTPWNFVTWLRTLIRVIKWAPDFLVFAFVGMFLWTMRSTRDVRSLALAVWIIAAALGTSAKRGADLNYYMSFRVIEALAAGTLWHAAMKARTSRGKLVAVCATAVTAIVLWPTVSNSLSLAEGAINTKSAASGPYGQLMSSTYREVLGMAKDANAKLLTDSGLFDAAQRERAVFGDPWLFHLLAETGQIDLEVIERRISSQYYDLIVTTSDLMMPQYAADEFALPTILVEPIRRQYESLGSRAGLYFYARRGQRAAGLPKAEGR
jgi:hypothetical protein